VLWRMAIILKANKFNLFVSSVLFIFWYHSPNFLDTPRIPRYKYVTEFNIYALVISITRRNTDGVFLYGIIINSVSTVPSFGWQKFIDSTLLASDALSLNKHF
jgi:hypothetical protein